MNQNGLKWIKVDQSGLKWIKVDQISLFFSNFLILVQQSVRGDKWDPIRDKNFRWEEDVWGFVTLKVASKC